MPIPHPQRLWVSLSFWLRRNLADHVVLPSMFAHNEIDMPNPLCVGALQTHDRLGQGIQPIVGPLGLNLVRIIPEFIELGRLLGNGSFRCGLCFDRLGHAIDGRGLGIKADMDAVLYINDLGVGTRQQAHNR